MGKVAVTIPGYGGINEAAARLGFSPTMVRQHYASFGDLTRLERFAAAAADPRGIEMPDGSRAASPQEAQQLLGVSWNTVYTHLCKYGHLRGAGLMDRGRAPLGEGERQIRLAHVPGVEIGVGIDPRPETAPRGSLMVSAGPIDVAAVIATIRRCRDQVLAEREDAA